MDLSRVDMLIGAPAAGCIASEEDVAGGINDPVARWCKLGWSVLGYLTPEGRDYPGKERSGQSLICTKVFKVREL